MLFSDDAASTRVSQVRASLVTSQTASRVLNPFDVEGSSFGDEFEHGARRSSLRSRVRSSVGVRRSAALATEEVPLVGRDATPRYDDGDLKAASGPPPVATIADLKLAARDPVCGGACGVSLPYPIDTFRILAVEFCERFAFYGIVYSLFTYMTLMLRVSTEDANFVMNALYTASPFSALLGAFLADGPLGRSLTLLLCSGTYTVGLVLVASSALPTMFADFPKEPSVNNFMLFGTGLVLLGSGYGGLKTCTGALAADQVTMQLWRSGLLDPDAAENGEVQGAVMGSLFRLIYWVITVGSSAGILICPFLRNVTGVTVGADAEPAAYYVPFVLCAGLSLLGVICFASGIRRYRQLSRDRSAEILTALFAAWGRWIAAGVCRAVACCAGGSSGSHRLPSIDAAIDGTFLAHGVLPPSFPAEAREQRLAVLRDLRQAVTACKSFVVLPIYWVLGNQYSTNFVLQTSWMERPSSVPPEVVHNISTLTSLVCIPVLDRVVFPCLFGERKPPTVPRIAIGFVMTVVAVSYGAALQVVIASRGEFDAKGGYVLHAGAERLSIFFQVPGYFLQGVSGCFVDITALEAAYVLAPASMKSLVVSVYWLCSGLSGLIGIFLSPLFKPDMFVPLFFALAGMLLVVTIAFAVVLRHLDAEVAAVAATKQQQEENGADVRAADDDVAV